MIKAVIDTNIIISAYLFDNKPEVILKMAKCKKLSLYYSEESLDELAKVLSYAKFKLSIDEQQLIVEDYKSYSNPIKIKKIIDIIQEDKTDNIFLSIAETVGADLIISGDKHILNLKDHYKISVVTVNEFFNLIK